MNKTRFFIALCFLLFSSVKVQAQIKDKDTLVQRIFTAVRNNDEQAYLKLFPSFNQLQAIFNHMLDNMKDSSMQKVLRQQFQQLKEEEYNRKLMEELKISFQQLMQKGREKGINWVDLTYVGSSTKEEDVDELVGRQFSGIIQLKDARQEYDLHFSDVIWSEPAKAWFGAMLNGITLKGEPLKSPLEEFREVDSALMVTDSILITEEVQPPPPPPPAKKPATKKPLEKKPVKSGTSSSPANKPKN